MNLSETIKQMGQPLEEKKPPFDTDKKDFAGAAKKIRDYAKKSGGVDKDDMMRIANELDALAKKASPRLLARTMRNIQDLDTDVRDKIKELMKESNCMESFEEALKLEESPEDDMPASMDEKSMALRQAEFIQYVGEEIEEFIEKEKPFPEWMQNKLSELHTKAEDVHSAMAGEYKDDEDELEEARNPSKSGGSGYDLYHKDFSSAMKHAYDYAKNKLGVEIDPQEIDDKVASGPRKPSKGKTNTYRLMGKDGKKAVQIQVHGMDSGKYELNMYKESVELDELKKYDKNKDYQLLNRLSQKAKTGKLTPSEKSQMANAKARLRNHGFSEEVELEEDFYNVIYRDKKGKVQGEKEFDTKSAAEKYAKLGNSRDKVGGKYTVTLVRDGGMGRRNEEVELDESLDFDAMFEESFEEPKLSLEDTLQAIWEGKMDPVNKKALKKDFDDRKDKDIDNDGDVDDSDEYLHKRRQATSKAISKGENKDSDAAEKEQEKEVSDKEDEPKGKVGKSGKQTKVDVNPSIEEKRKYTPPTAAEIERDKKKDRKGSGTTNTHTRSKQYKGMMGGLKEAEGEPMTAAEKEKMEKIKAKLDQKKDEFVKKYGDRAKEVIARTAIKMAKKSA